jgi:cytidine deaminase
LLDLRATPPDYKELIKKSIEAQSFSYSPYSNFKVGAAVLTKSGKVYTGCNIENASFGATNCAERTAIFKAISDGERDFVAIAITSGSKKFTYPCGICRQVINEFSSDMDIVLEDENKGIKIYKASEIFPLGFKLGL